MNDNEILSLQRNNLDYAEDYLQHAYLISGKNQSKIQDLAYAFSHKILCDFGGVSENKWFEKSVSDFIVIEDEKISIDTVRTLTSKLYMEPLDGKYKVILFLNAGNMRQEAQNALLKSIEEPPAYIVWILLTNNSSKLLPTIQSRCQIVLDKDGETESEGIISGLLPIIEGALKGEEIVFFANRDFFDKNKENKLEMINQISLYLQNLLLLLNGLESSKIVERQPVFNIPEWKNSVEKMKGLVNEKQIIQGINAAEEFRQLFSVNINFMLGIEHVLLKLSENAAKLRRNE